VLLHDFYNVRVVNDRRLLARLTTAGALRVPEITVYFWVIKALSTAVGESTSDYSVKTLGPVPAVLLGFAVFAIALVIQFSVRRYMAWTYWLAVVMVGVFGTQAADVLHVGFGVPYTVSSSLYAVVLVAVFVIWGATEKTLSIHTIDTPRREVFYWAAVVATFAMGTALGDLTATTFHLGYLTSGVMFAVVIAIPALGYRLLRWNPIFSFWFAYVATRPLGASFADYMGKPKSVGGLGWGDGPVALVLAIAIFCLVAYLAATRRDVQGISRHGRPRQAAAEGLPAEDTGWPSLDDPAEDAGWPPLDDPARDAGWPPDARPAGYAGRSPEEGLAREGGWSPGNGPAGRAGRSRGGRAAGEGPWRHDDRWPDSARPASPPERTRRHRRDWS
jgi:uncharacterized membrane-anchored protein